MNRPLRDPASALGVAIAGITREMTWPRRPLADLRLRRTAAAIERGLIGLDSVGMQVGRPGSGHIVDVEAVAALTAAGLANLTSRDVYRLTDAGQRALDDERERADGRAEWDRESAEHDAWADACSSVGEDE